MIRIDETACPVCGGSLKEYDKVFRIVRTKYRATKRIKIRRLRCLRCGKVHRELPDELFPFKQYEAEMIKGVLEGFITPHTIGFIDFPSRATMARWIIWGSKRI